MKTSTNHEYQSICTVSSMAAQLKISRARFYQLLREGVFPPPAYCLFTHKPVYPAILQKECMTIRKTGIGYNGQYVRFYSHRKIKKVKPEHKQLAVVLRKMGLTVTPQQVRKALVQLKLHTTEAAGTDGDIIRMLVQHFYRECQKGV